MLSVHPLAERAGVRGPLAVGLALLLLVASCVPARAAEGPAAVSADYSGLLAPDRSEESFAARTRRETRTYPYMEHAQRMIAAGDLASARSDLEIYLDREPGDLQARYMYGVVLASLGDQAGAARQMGDVLTARPDFGPAALQRGLARQRMGDQRGALADFRAASRSGVLAPADRVLALDSLALVAAKVGDDQAALFALDALASAPPSTSRDLLHAEILAKAGRVDEALARLDAVAESSVPKKARLDALLQTTQLELSRGRLARARVAAERALTLDPTDRAAWLDRLAEIATQEGDEDAAVAFRKRAREAAPSVGRQRALVVSEERAGHFAAAADAMRDALAADGSGAPSASDLERLAVLEAQAGRHAEAGEALVAAHRAGARPRPDLLLRAAREYAAAGRDDQARALLEEIARDARADRALRSTALLELGQRQLASGQDVAALRTLERAASLGKATWDTRQAMGDIELRRGRANQALQSYRAAWRLRKDPRSALGIGYAYQQLGKPGLAVFHMEQALATRGALTPAERLGAERALGYLYTELGQHDRAAKVWSRAQALEVDPTITLRLARAERLAGHPLAAARTLEAARGSWPSPKEEAFYWQERGMIAQETGDMAGAEECLARSIELDTTPERLEILGNLLAEQGRAEEAEPLLARALAEGGPSATRAAALGHVRRDLGDPQGASRLFAEALEADPDILSLYEDDAYTLLEDHRNPEAVTRLEEAIDNAPLHAVETRKQRRSLARRIDRLRREVAEIDRVVSLVAYTSICFGESQCRLGETALIEGASESQGGAELAVRPPVVGFRNGRILEVISRVLYQQETNSIEPIGKTTVATLGLRYKPLRTQDLRLSVERIFGVGSETTDNTLLRASWGWLRGYRMYPQVSHWSYTTLFLDLAYTVENPRNLFFYAEGRQGVSFNYANRAMLTPLVYFRTRNLAGDDDDFNELDLGVGLSLRWLFREDRYHFFRSSLELLPRVGYDAFNSEGRGWNIFLTAVVQL